MDTVSDFLAFAIAASILMVNEFNVHPAVAGFFVLASVARLIYFMKTKNSTNFYGVPTTIAGGLLATSPDRKDWENPDIHDYLEHYLGGSANFSTEDRLKMIAAAQRMVCSHESAFHEVTTVHAEGSIQASTISLYRNYDFSPMRKSVKQLASLED